MVALNVDKKMRNDLNGPAQDHAYSRGCKRRVLQGLPERKDVPVSNSYSISE